MRLAPENPTSKVSTKNLKQDILDKKNIKNDIAVQIEKLFRKDRKKFLGFIRQRVKSNEEAEDILQDVFTNVLAASRNAQKPIENVASWVFTAVRNRIIDHYRKKRADTFSDLEIPGQDDESYGVVDHLLVDHRATPENEYMRKMILETVEEGLDEMPEEQKDVFVKNEFEGVSFREMSEETGLNINTLLARKRYAVLALRKKLQPIYNSMIS